MRRFRRVPIEVEAEQLPPLSQGGAVATWQEIASWCGGRVAESGQHSHVLYLDTAKGKMFVLADLVRP